MYLNGAVTGLVVTRHQHRLILPAQQVAFTACSVAVVGATVRTTAECRIATTTTPTFASTTLGSV